MCDRRIHAIISLIIDAKIVIFIRMTKSFDKYSSICPIIYTLNIKMAIIIGEI